MKQVSIGYAKLHLPTLIDEAQRGAAVVILKAGKPAAKLVRICRLGFMAGQITGPDDFDRMSHRETEQLLADGD